MEGRRCRLFGARGVREWMRKWLGRVAEAVRWAAIGRRGLVMALGPEGGGVEAVMESR